MPGNPDGFGARPDAMEMTELRGCVLCCTGGKYGAVSGSRGVLVWFWKIRGVPGTPDGFEAGDATGREPMYAGAHCVSLGVHKHAAGSGLGSGLGSCLGSGWAFHWGWAWGLPSG